MKSCAWQPEECPQPVEFHIVWKREGTSTASYSCAVHAEYAATNLGVRALHEVEQACFSDDAVWDGPGTGCRVDQQWWQERWDRAVTKLCT